LNFGDYEWVCFAAQQVAEKAMKALYQSRGIEVWGHSVSRMLESLPEGLKPNRDLVDKAKELDRHHISMRYPNLHPEGAPMDSSFRLIIVIDRTADLLTKSLLLT
jgi:HEPN domain-containing protein